MLEYDFHIADILNIGSGISADHRDIRLFAFCYRADPIGNAQQLRPVESSYLDCLHGCESGLDQQFQFTLIAKSSNDATPPGWVGASNQ